MEAKENSENLYYTIRRFSEIESTIEINHFSLHNLVELPRKIVGGLFCCFEKHRLSHSLNLSTLILSNEHH